MKNIVGIRFRKPGKVYFFDPGYIRLNPKDKVIVETSLGEDIGEVVISKRELPDEKVPKVRCVSPYIPTYQHGS